MKAKSTFKCLHCKEKHRADARNAGRQRYCGKPECRRASKAARQRRSAMRPENREYFKGAENCQRVRRWREAHPGYWRRKKPRGADALQEPCTAQEPGGEQLISTKSEFALQDPLRAQEAVLVGLISAVTGLALQEDIVASLRSFQARGADILRMGPGCTLLANDEEETDFVSRTAAAGAPSVQLDRSALGARAPYPWTQPPRAGPLPVLVHGG